MAPALIELDDVGQKQPALHGGKRALDQRIGLSVGIRVNAGDSSAGEEIVDLAYADSWDLTFCQTIQQRRPRRGKTEIPPVWSTFPGTGLAHEWTSYDARHSVPSLQKLPCDYTGTIQVVEWNSVFVSSDLKNAVSGGVDDPAASATMLRGELVQYRSAGGGPVPQDGAPCTPGELIHDFRGKALRIGRERTFEHYPADFPVSCRTILAWTRRLTGAVRGRRRHVRVQTSNRRTTAEPESL
jgi:hypothetical protein